MLFRQRIAVVVPARDEAAHIARVLRTMPTYVDVVVVVDDGSGDETAALAKAHGGHRLRLVRHARSRGVGAALASGYGAAFEAGADVVAVMAGDGQMDPTDLRALLAPVLVGDAGYAKGNRLGHQDLPAMPRHRRWGNRVLSALTRLATGLSVGDSQCGYTAISRAAFQRVPWRRVWPGYGYPNDLLGWLALRDVAVRDVCVRPVYGDEQSGIRLRHALLTIPLLLARIALRRATGTWLRRRASPVASPSG